MLLGVLQHPQLFAIAENDPLKKTLGSAVFRGTENDGHLVSGLHGIFSPAGSGQLAWTEGFDVPVHESPLSVLRVEENLGVGVRPHELGHGTLQGEGPGLIIGGIPMMSEGRNHGNQKANGHQK